MLEQHGSENGIGHEIHNTRNSSALSLKPGLTDSIPELLVPAVITYDQEPSIQIGEGGRWETGFLL